MGKSGILSSVAAGVALMIVSIVTMLVLSSMVAFKGWPGPGSVGDSHGSVAIARVQTGPQYARQRVVLASPRPATRRRARPASRRGSVPPPGAARKVTYTRRAASDRSPPRGEADAGTVLAATAIGATQPSRDEAPTPETHTRQEPSGPLAKTLENVATGTDALLPGVTPVRDVLDALRPNTP